MAPEETTTTSDPRALHAATTSTSLLTASASSAEPALPVREDEPILMTIRCAEVICARLTCHLHPLIHSLHLLKS